MTTRSLESLSFDIATLHAAYVAGDVTPEAVMREVLRRVAQHRDRNAWISLRSEMELICAAQALSEYDVRELPLYGLPFAIKDNIDLAGMPTTAACPDFVYTPEQSAFVVERLVAAGAIAIGKTNMDQFATGLNGTRTPQQYGICRNSFNPDYIAGGSSSGSAVAVALGMVSFALGTDTAGSGRVPAAFNNLIGLKPTRGLLSTRGVVPACRSLDCVSIFALTAADAARVCDVAAVFDSDDPYARCAGPAGGARAASPTGLRIGVPRAQDLEFFGDEEGLALFHQAVKSSESLGAQTAAVDLTPFVRAARLLYDGPWVAERYAAIRAFIERTPASLHPVVRQVIEPSGTRTAVEAFEAQYALQGLRREAEGALADVDALLIPTAPGVYRIEEMLADPIVLNSRLGQYTNFVNLLDLAAVAVPTGFRANGLPFGVTLCAAAFSDRRLLSFANRMQQALKLPLGATGMPCPAEEIPLPNTDTVAVVVCGAHMSGLPLNTQLTNLGATLKARTRTAPRYRLYALTAFTPPRPGLLRDEANGVSIEVEVWDLPAANLGAFFRLIPSPLSLGRVELADGSSECGFLCEPFAVADAKDISALGSWRAYLASLR